MKKAVVLLFLLASVVRGLAKDPELPVPDSAYFTKLRMDYANRADFSPMWSIGDAPEAIKAAYKEKDYKKVFELSNDWLTKCPVDVTTHFLRASAAVRLGEMKSYFHHTYFAYGLMQSVMQSGDGLTPETAYKVISVEEEYYLLRDFGADVIQQSLIGDKKPCDKMDCKLPSGEKFTVYFDVTISFEASRKVLVPANAK